jgi:hypothetical protein
MSSRAALDPLVGLMQPAGRVFEVPGLVHVRLVMMKHLILNLNLLSSILR